MAKLLLRRIFQVTVASVFCLAGLQADTFSLPNGGHAFGATPEYSRLSVVARKATGIQAIVDEFQVNSPSETPHYATATVAPSSSSYSQHQTANPSSAYSAALYLAAQMIGVDRSTSFGKAQASVVNYAMWNLFTPSTASYHFGEQQAGPKDSDLQFWAKSDGGKGVGSRSFAGVNIWKPWQKGSRESVAVPEPSLISMLAFDVLVLAGLGFALRRRGILPVN